MIHFRIPLFAMLAGGCAFFPMLPHSALFLGFYAEKFDENFMMKIEL